MTCTALMPRTDGSRAMQLAVQGRSDIQQVRWYQSLCFLYLSNPSRFIPPFPPLCDVGSLGLRLYPVYFGPARPPATPATPPSLPTPPIRLLTTDYQVNRSLTPAISLTVAAEALRASATESSLGVSVAVVAAAVGTEVARATAADASLASGLQRETSRAVGTEQSLTASLTPALAQLAASQVTWLNPCLPLPTLVAACPVPGCRALSLPALLCLPCPACPVAAYRCRPHPARLVWLVSARPHLLSSCAPCPPTPAWQSPWYHPLHRLSFHSQPRPPLN